LEQLLENIPNMFENNRVADSAFGAAMKVYFYLFVLYSISFRYEYEVLMSYEQLVCFLIIVLSWLNG
jgi:hypothetical protein